MKKSLIGFICFFAGILSVHAQTLYGTTERTITKFIPATNNLTVAKSFEGFAVHPTGSLIQARNGKLYGMMTAGFGDNFGVIFSFDPSSSTYTKLHDFDGTNGSNPQGSLIQASNGKLYGMTAGGGSSGNGVIFSFDPSSSTYIKLKDFDFYDGDGASPNGSLMQASDGKLYGMTTFGGSDGWGVIFSFDPSSSTYTKLKDLDGQNGSAPFGSLIEARDGKLYGMTSDGGRSFEDDVDFEGYGVIFSFDLSSSTYTNLHDFSGDDGANPFGSLIQASDGKLYGMTQWGGSRLEDEPHVMYGGVIFSFDPSSSTYIKLLNFDRTNGENPQNNLMQASDGKLYAMTTAEGTSGPYGVIFSFDPSSSTYTKLKEFDLANGGSPRGSAFIEVKDNQNKAPIVSLTTPNNNSTYISPANVKLTATATDEDGKISKVEFYNGTHLLHTEYVAPYGFKWSHVPTGNYTLTAKATDNSGLVTTSAAVHISIVSNKAPTVRIIKPHNNQSFAAPVYIGLKANAKDPGGRIIKVEFYNGTILLSTEHKHPYKYVWKKVPAGTYTITAKAYDDKGLSATSSPVKIKVKNTSIVSRAPSVNVKTDLNDALSLKLSPVPAHNTLQIYTKGLLNKLSTISVISVSGIVLKTIQSNELDKVVQLDVSSLVSGVYTLKVMSGNKVLYKKFVKL